MKGIEVGIKTLRMLNNGNQMVHFSISFLYRLVLARTCRHIIMYICVTILYYNSEERESI